MVKCNPRSSNDNWEPPSVWLGTSRRKSGRSPETLSEQVLSEQILEFLAYHSGVDKRVVSRRVVLADVPPEQKPERGYIRMFPWNENRNVGTFACSPGTKTGTRAHSPKPPFYETALLSPSNRYGWKSPTPRRFDVQSVSRITSTAWSPSLFGSGLFTDQPELVMTFAGVLRVFPNSVLQRLWSLLSPRGEALQ